MQILINQNVFNKFNNLINFTSKKELKNFSNPIKQENSAFEAVSLAKYSDGVAQVAMQNKSVEIFPEIQRKVQEFAKRFGVSSDTFLKIAQKEPEFFNRNLETLDKNITESAKRFGVEKSRFVDAALKQPPLFYQSPETLDKNITESAKRFGIEKSRFVDAVLKQPSLFTQSPETLDKNITESAKRFGIEKSKFLEVALKQPSLFSLLPETLERKARIYSYYKELRHQPINNLLECLSLLADKHLLSQVLGVLINQQTEKNVSVVTKTRYNQIKEFLEKNPGSYDLKIHDRKIVTEKLLEFSSQLEKELLNKVKFNFKVI